jgi:hypothetical protein
MIAAHQIAFGGGGKRKPYDAEIEFLKSTGTQWIDTGVSLCDSNGVFADTAFFECKFLVSLRNDRAFWVVGRHEVNSWEIGVGDYANSRPLVKFGREISIIGQTSPVRHITSVHADIGGAWVNGTYYDQTIEGRILGSENAIRLFATVSLYDTVTPVASNIWIYSFSAKGVNGEVDLIPVRVGDVGYMYDKVSGKLFGNQGTGEFVLGSDI